MRTIDEATRTAAVELQQIVADYWHEVDENDSRSSPEFFTEDCVFDVAGKKFIGRAGVREFYDNRALRGKRTTRHTFVNFRVVLEGESRAKVSYVSILYAADGPAPIMNFVGPAVVSNVESVCERNGSGRWLFKSVRGYAVFIGNEPYSRGMLVKN